MHCPRPVRAEALAFLVAFATLSVQVLVHRIVLAKVVNNYAFLVISLTMLGLALSGVILTRWFTRFHERWSEAATSGAALFALSLIGVTAIFSRVDLAGAFVAARLDYVRVLAGLAPYALLFAVPFIFAGLLLGTLLASPVLSTRRVYFADLVGSAAGAFAVIPTIGWWGAERSAMLAAALPLAGALVLDPPRGRVARALAGLAALGLGVGLADPDRVFRMRYPEGTFLAQTQTKSRSPVLERVVWDPVARVEVTRIDPPEGETGIYAALLGGDRQFHRQFRRVLTQNNNAFTYAVDYDGRPESLAGVAGTLYAAAYEADAPPRARVLVIGVGGGFDILTALGYGASEVTAVEVNGAIVDLLRRTYRDDFGAWTKDPRVRLVHDEGRRFLAASRGGFDVIQLSGVDSASGTAAAAHVFSESYLYTSEAFDLLLSRLGEDGVICMLRMEWRPPREMLRALITASDALRRAGVTRPADHLATVTSASGDLTALLVRKRPFTEAQVARLDAWASRGPYFHVSAAPGRVVSPPTLYQSFLALGDPRLERALVTQYAYDIRPVTDDRPFFFRFSFWRHLAGPLPEGSLGISLPLMELTLCLLFAVVCTAAAICVVAPPLILARQGLHVPGVVRYTVFFAGIGLGYMAVEVALLQQFGLFLGHPNHALSVVLAGLLFASGLGALLSDRMVASLGRLRYVSYVFGALVLAEYWLVLPRLGELVQLGFPLRVGLAMLLILPLGLCLGAFLPSALELLKSKAPDYVPWAWGVNGAFSVLAPICAVGVSMTWGMSALLLASVPLYLTAAIALPDERV